MAFLRLKNSQLIRLRDILRAANATEAQFEELLLRLDRTVTDYAASAAPFPTAILNTLKFANAELWWRDLLREASNAVRDPALLAFAEEVGFAPDIVVADQVPEAPLKGRQLELKIEETGTTFDILTWRQKIAEIEGRVCRIEFPSRQARGTGFLIGPDLVMTNYHVIRKVHRKMVGYDKVVCRFDYKVLADGVSTGPGKPYTLAQKWLVDHSEYSELDFETSPSADAPADKLDYAILRLAGRAGDDAVAGDAGQPVARRWIEVPPDEYNFMRDRALNIVQHPDGMPMQIAINSKAVIAATATRVRYTTTTQPGSSGSPCFSADWKWIALHHSGDPKYRKEGKKPEYNQGVPAAAIVTLLTQRGMGSIFQDG
jgi:V8-like Glu-specific endopeptidase